MIDVVTGLIEILKNDTDVSDLVGERIYGEELTRDEIENMPRKTIAIVSAGGYDERKQAPTTTPRFDVWCYGETKYEASTLGRAVYDAIKAIDRVTIRNMLIHSAGLSAGPRSYRDPGSGWPAMILTVYVTVDEREIN